VLSRSSGPLRTLHLDGLVLLVARCLSDFTHFVITFIEAQGAYMANISHPPRYFKECDLYLKAKPERG